MVSFKGFIKDSERFIEKVGSAAQSHMNLLERLFQSPLLVERLEAPVMLVHNRLLRIQHKTIDGGHECLSIQ